MKSSHLKTAGICCSLLLAAATYAQSYNKLNTRTQTVIDSTYNSLLKKYKVVGASIAIVDNGEIVYATGYGFSDREKQVKASEKTVYRIGSCTKSFTSLSILQLQEKGKLTTDQSVKKYLPELTIGSRFNDNNEIFINDMMCHVSGLPCDINNGFFCDAPPDMSWVVQELNKQTTISPRRYKRSYSNIAYGLLGEVVARTANTTYAGYVRENIFKPLDMNASFIDADDKLMAEYSKGYCKDKVFKEPLIRDQAAGLIHSNVVDMSHYVMMYLNKGTYNGKQVLSAASVKEMEDSHLQDVLLSSKDNWGYGLYTKKVVVKSGSDSSVVKITGHGGDTYAFHSDFAYIPELNIGVVVLTNTDNGNKIRSANKLLKIYLKEARSKKVNFDYREPAGDAKWQETACTPEEIKGQYNLNALVIDVKNARKIKFKQGSATVVFKSTKADPQHYRIKAMVFGIVPVKIKNQEVTFVKLNNAVFIKSTDTKTKDADYLAVKSDRKAIPQSWKSSYGNYKITGKMYACTDCPFGQHEGMTLKLSESKGFVLVTTKGKTRDTNNKIYTDVISDKLATTGGIGRGTGETVRILDNGNIYYSGMEFEKVK